MTRPSLLILDEAWVFLDDPEFSSRIREWLKTLRKRSASMIFATNSVLIAILWYWWFDLLQIIIGQSN